MVAAATDLDAIAQAIGAATGRPFEIVRRDAAGGGCINQAETLTGTDGRRCFIKLNQADKADMFSAEAAGLEALAAARALRVPRPLAWGVEGGRAWLALEWLDLSSRGDATALGRGLARLHGLGHEVSQADFGWQRSNTIGATPQDNTPHADWICFYRDRRLEPQRRLAQDNGAPRRLLAQVERLQDQLADFFPGYSPRPSLLHGDLWGGNFAYAEGEPVLFDPAVYYGDREADLAMTELFGGFPAAFYAAYREAWPLDPGYGVRRSLYNLYHVLNHYNLFGGSYADQAEAMAARLLAERG